MAVSNDEMMDYKSEEDDLLSTSSHQSEEDEAPEEVALKESKTAVLEKERARKEAIKMIFQKTKEHRKRRDQHLKSQAAARRTSKQQIAIVEDNLIVSLQPALKMRDEKTERAKEMYAKGIIKVSKRQVGLQEKEAYAKLREAKLARMAGLYGEIQRRSVSGSFALHQSMMNKL